MHKIEIGKIIRQLKNCFSKQFTGLVRGIYSGIFSPEDINIYIDNIPNYYEVMDNYKQEQERQKHKKEYEDTIQEKNTLPAELKEQADKVIQLLSEEIDMTNKGYAYEEKKGLEKYNKIRKLEIKKAQAQKTSEILDALAKEYTPKKKGPGRTRKDGSPARSKKLQQIENKISCPDEVSLPYPQKPQQKEKSAQQTDAPTPEKSAEIQPSQLRQQRGPQKPFITKNGEISQSEMLSQILSIFSNKTKKE